MVTLNIEFLEEYKHLDRLCRDLLGSAEGVSEYIRQMDMTPQWDRRYAVNWELDYRQLKRLRAVRNRLVHDDDIRYADRCTEEDLAWVKAFCSRILNENDPFCVVRKGKEAEAKRLAQQRQTAGQTPQWVKKSNPAPQTIPTPPAEEPKPRKPLVKRLFEKLRALLRR